MKLLQGIFFSSIWTFVLIEMIQARRSAYRLPQLQYMSTGVGRSAAGNDEVVGTGRDLLKKFMLLRGMFQQPAPSDNIIVITEPTGTTSSSPTTTTTTTTITNGTGRAAPQQKHQRQQPIKLIPKINNEDNDDNEDADNDELTTPTGTVNQEDMYPIEKENNVEDLLDMPKKRNRPQRGSSKRKSIQSTNNSKKNSNNYRRHHKHKSTKLAKTQQRQQKPNQQQQQQRQRQRKRKPVETINENGNGNEVELAEREEFIEGYHNPNEQLMRPQSRTESRLQRIWKRFQRN